jgi:hypothetical protein
MTIYSIVEIKKAISDKINKKEKYISENISKSFNISLDEAKKYYSEVVNVLSVVESINFLFRAFRIDKQDSKSAYIDILKNEDSVILKKVVAKLCNTYVKKYASDIPDIALIKNLLANEIHHSQQSKIMHESAKIKRVSQFEHEKRMKDIKKSLKYKFGGV